VVSVCTPSSTDDLKRMIEMQVDAITTNRPDVLKKILSGK
jgi:glycerophosphoryl diester phosphodiesterase